MRTIAKEPLVSIIVCLFNNYEMLTKNFASICQQSYRRMELIVADDCSRSFDNNRIKAMIPNIEIFEKVTIFSNPKNIGTTQNFSKAIRMSEGDLIVPLSADDVFIDENVVSEIVRFFNNTNAKICYGKRRGQVSGLTYPTEDDKEIIVSNNDVFGRMCFSGLFSGSTLYYKKDFWYEMGGFNENYRLLEDFPFAIKVYESGNTIKLFDRLCISYGESGVSSGGKTNGYIQKDLDILFSYMLDSFKNVVNKKCYRYISFFKFVNMHRTFCGKILAFLHFPIISYKRIVHKYLISRGKYKKDFYQFYLK